MQTLAGRKAPLISEGWWRGQLGAAVWINAAGRNHLEKNHSSSHTTIYLNLSGSQMHSSTFWFESLSFYKPRSGFCEHLSIKARIKSWPLEMTFLRTQFCFFSYCLLPLESSLTQIRPLALYRIYWDLLCWTEPHKKYTFWMICKCCNMCCLSNFSCQPQEIMKHHDVDHHALQV